MMMMMMMPKNDDWQWLVVDCIVKQAGDEFAVAAYR